MYLESKTYLLQWCTYILLGVRVALFLISIVTLRLPDFHVSVIPAMIENGPVFRLGIGMMGLWGPPKNKFG